MEIIKGTPRLGRPSCIAVGYFDGVHLGHAAVIGAAVREAKKRGCLSAVLTFDMSGARSAKKGGVDLATMDERVREAGKLGADVFVALDFSEICGLTGGEFVNGTLAEGLRAEYVVCGRDFRFSKGRSCGTKELKTLCAKLGIKVKVVGDVVDSGEPISTSRIKELVKSGDMERARELLGRPYGFTLPVVRGKGLAHRLGFPTMNQRFPEGVALPRFGVYETTVFVNGGEYPGVTNVGLRPTVEHDEQGVFIETYAVGYDGDAYGDDVRVEFNRFMRDERRFSGEEELRRAVMKDVQAVKTRAFTPG